MALASRDSVFFRTAVPAEGWDGGRAAVSASQRARLLDAVTRAVAAKGYARTTVADIVALAGVSRRTFYERFADKEECLLAAYQEASAALLADVRRAVGGMEQESWRERLAAAITAYLRSLAADPALTATLLVDVLGAGPRAVALRRTSLRAFADGLRAVLPRPEALDPLFLDMLVAGIGEVVAQHVADHGAEGLESIGPQLVRFALAVAEPAAGS